VLIRAALLLDEGQRLRRRSRWIRRSDDGWRWRDGRRHSERGCGRGRRQGRRGRGRKCWSNAYWLTRDDGWRDTGRRRGVHGHALGFENANLRIARSAADNFWPDVVLRKRIVLNGRGPLMGSWTRMEQVGEANVTVNFGCATGRSQAQHSDDGLPMMSKVF
jgi:hypothetical protein